MRTLYDARQIDARVAELAAEITKDYAGKKPLLVGILKGSAVFLSHLLVKLTTDVEIDFMTLSSYKHGTVSQELKLVQDLDTDVSGRDVLVVEDIVDSGKTVAFVDRYLRVKGARSIEIVTLLRKPGRIAADTPPARYVGFDLPDDAFVVGWGLDLAERYRNLPGIYAMEGGDA